MGTTDSGYYKAENLRLELLGQPDRWVMTKDGMQKVNVGTTHHFTGFYETFVLTEHFIERLYERTNITLEEFKNFLMNLYMDQVTWKKDIDGAPIKLAHIPADGIKYAIVMRETYDKDGWVLSTIVVPKQFKKTTTQSEVHSGNSKE